MERKMILQILAKIFLIIVIVVYAHYTGTWTNVLTLFLGLSLWSLALALTREAGVTV